MERRVAALPRTLVVLFAIVFFGHLLSCSEAATDTADANLPNPSWQTICPSPYQRCATVEVYQNWAEKGARLSFSVNALMSDPRQKELLMVWLLMDQVDLSLAKQLHREGMNVIVFSPRGSANASPHYTCANTKVKQTSQCWMTSECAAELADGNAQGLNVSNFAISEVAHDLEWALSKLGDGHRNVVIGQGLSSSAVLRFLQQQPNTNTAVMLIDYINPQLFDVNHFFGGGGMDAALQHLLGLCDDDPLCVGRLGAVDGSWNRLQSILLLADNGNLVCAKKLDWPSAANKKSKTSFARVFRSVLAALMQTPTYIYASGSIDLLSLIPSVLYRLGRCSHADIVALNNLHAYLTGNPTCPSADAGPLQMNWLVNEHTSAAAVPSDVSAFVTATAARFTVSPPGDAAEAYYAAYAKFPKYSRQGSEPLVPVNATQEVLLIVADVDPKASSGAASQMAISFSHYGDNVQLRHLRGTSSNSIPALTPCIINSLKFFQDHHKWGDEGECTVDSTKDIDFTNVVTTSFYNTADAWSFDYPNTDYGPSGQPVPSDIPSNGGRIAHIAKVLLAILVVSGAIAGGVYLLKEWRRRGSGSYSRVSDNFFENLH